MSSPTNWQTLLEEIRVVQTEIASFAPYRDFGLTPNPGASKLAVSEVERRLSHPLPPSYRAFLERHDGWPRFFEGACLLGTANLGKRLYLDLVESVLMAAETPVPDVGPPSRSRRLPALIPFGVDVQASTLFAFNPEVRNADGEFEVIAWINEIGVRRDSFDSFLELVLDLCVAELEAGHALKSA